MACARRDALNSLNGKAGGLQQSLNTYFDSSSPSSALISASISTSTFALKSSFASSATSFSEQQLGSFSSSLCIPSGLDPIQGEDIEQADEYNLWEFVTPATISTPIPPPYQQQLQRSCTSFKSHYQRVVALENALKEENRPFSSFPSALSRRQLPVPSSSPATNVAPISTSVAVQNHLPAQKQNASSFDGTTVDEERARTPCSRGVHNANSDDNAPAHSLADRDPGVLGHYWPQRAYPPLDWIRGGVVDDDKDGLYDYDGEDSGSELDDSDGESVVRIFISNFPKLLAPLRTFPPLSAPMGVLGAPAGPGKITPICTAARRRC